MCTVSRPGLAAIASATAVEMLISLLTHPLGYALPPPSSTPFFHYPQWFLVSFPRLIINVRAVRRAAAPAESPAPSNDDSGPETDGTTSSPLGIVPHQLRGGLSSFQTLNLRGDAFSMCTACGPKVRSCGHSSSHALYAAELQRMADISTLPGLSIS
jgi:ubiquitin-like modifier-activating enzyme ATG7